MGWLSWCADLCRLASVAFLCMGKAPGDWRTAMSSVKRAEAFFCFFLLLKDSLSWFFLSVRFRVMKRLPGFGNRSSRCSSCYPCSAPRGRHQLTHTVTARKQARPISKSGRGRPQCANGRAPFQIVPVGSWHRLRWWFWVAVGRLHPDHLPAEVSGLHPPRTPAPQIHGHLPGHGDNGFL